MDCWIEGLNGTTLSGCLFAVQSFLVGSDTLRISQKSIPTEYHLLISRFLSSLWQIAKSSLQSHQAHFCQIVHFISPSSPTPHHQCYVANSPNPLDCPKCSSKFPGLKFYGLPNTWNVFLFCPQQRRLPNFRNVLKPLYFSPFDGSCKLWEQPF